MPLNKENAIFERAPLLTGRTEIEQTNKLNTGLIWSCSGNAFDTRRNLVDGRIAVNSNGRMAVVTGGADRDFLAPVNLPHGAIVTSVIVYGSISDETYSLIRVLLIDGATVSTMATGNFNTQDSVITDEVINNSSYAYFLVTSTLDSDDIIYGARITYTI